ncbi:hypothetical protein [Rhodococcus zopfii]|uniref:hypothetical protein n=1 Tax=Rhodococcus zopfii TaxID=43772 RepID=UPI0035299E05
MSAPLAPAPTDAGAAAALAAATGTGAPVPGAAAQPVTPAAPLAPAPPAQAPATHTAPAQGENGLTLEQALAEIDTLRTRNQELEPLEVAAREAEDRDKTDLQREQDRNAQLATQLAVSQRETVVARYQIPKEYEQFVTGSTPEAQEASAKLLGDLIAKANGNAAPAAPVPPPSERPLEGLRPGATPAPPGQPDHSYPASWA